MLFDTNRPEDIAYIRWCQDLHSPSTKFPFLRAWVESFRLQTCFRRCSAGRDHWFLVSTLDLQSKNKKIEQHTFPPVPLWLVKSPPDRKKRRQSDNNENLTILTFMIQPFTSAPINLTLAHELGNHTVEWRSLVAKSRLTGAQLTKVFGGLGCNIGAKFKFDAPDIFSSHFHIKVDYHTKKVRRVWDGKSSTRRWQTWVSNVPLGLLKSSVVRLKARTAPGARKAVADLVPKAAAAELEAANRTPIIVAFIGQGGKGLIGSSWGVNQ